MFKALKYMMFATLLAGFAACVDNRLADDDFVAGSSQSDELPVDFTFMLPSAETRGIPNEKTGFSGNDMIHIQGKFSMKDKDGTATADLIRYGALRYNATTKKWEAVEGSGLTWPTQSVSGQFTAYFVPRVSGTDSDNNATGGILSADAPSITHLLSELKAQDGDPLKAESEAVGYGHAIKLKFKHLCTYLTLTYIEPMVADSYLFTRDVGDEPDAEPVLKNAFKLTIDPATNELSFNFIAQPDSNYKGPDNGLPEDDTQGLVYISGAAASSNVTDSNGNIVTVSQTSYFLEPGFYSDFTIRYKTSINSTYEYLKYNYLPDDEENTKNRPDFEAGVPYTLDITKSQGVDITQPGGDDDWKDGDPIYKVDVEEFLRAVRNHEAYIYHDDNANMDVTVLEKTSTGTRLLYSVDFQFYEYDVFTEGTGAIFEPNVNSGSIFDGGKHYIHNLSGPLFFQNNGTIQNLGIKNIDTSKRNAGSIHAERNATHTPNGITYDQSSIGGVCKVNSSNGTIRNVRIEDDVILKVQVESKENDGIEEGGEVFNIGCVAGLNDKGTVEDVALAGKFKVEVCNYNETVGANAQILIGGIIGQNSGEVSRVTPKDDALSIEVTNKCTGRLGAFYVGGIAGASSGRLYDIVLPDVKVDGSESKGIVSVVGGVAGQLSADPPGADSGNVWIYGARVEDCFVSGEATAGNVEIYKNLSCYSYIGGVAGVLKDVSVSYCSTTVSVNGLTAEPPQEVIYAAGGAFGRILTSVPNGGTVYPPAPVSNLIVYGQSLRGGTAGDSYTGRFAGLVQEGVTWDNYPQTNVTLNEHGGYEVIGGTTDRQF